MALGVGVAVALGVAVAVGLGAGVGVAGGLGEGVAVGCGVAVGAVATAGASATESAQPAARPARSMTASRSEPGSSRMFAPRAVRATIQCLTDEVRSGKVPGGGRRSFKSGSRGLLRCPADAGQRDERSPRRAGSPQDERLAVNRSASASQRSRSGGGRTIRNITEPRAATIASTMKPVR